MRVADVGRCSRPVARWTCSWALVLLCGGTACTEDALAPAPNPSSAPSPASGCSAAEANRCQTAQQTAQELFDTHAACQPGDRCVVVNQPELGMTCSPTGLFHCPFALNGRTDLAAFAARAREIQGGAAICLECGAPCPRPTCIPPDVRAVCAEQGRCVLTPR